jgi:nitroreductase
VSTYTETPPESAFPRDGGPDDRLRFLVHYAVLAPSVLNTQPWRFAVEGGVLRLYADRRRQLPHLDPTGRELTVSCGAALSHLRVASRHFGYAAAVRPFPVPGEPDLLAAVALDAPYVPAEADHRLFRAIGLRRTNRQPFAETPVPAAATAALETVARAEGARLAVLAGEAERAAVAALVEEGIRLQATDRPLVEEIRRWLRPEGDPRPDGVPDAVQGQWDRRAIVDTPGAALAAATRALVAAAPALLVLTTETDAPAAWLAAGQALAHVLLAAADRGLLASYANQPVEVERLRPELAALVGDGFPQVLFRIGYPAQREGTPRRPVGDVLGAP